MEHFECPDCGPHVTADEDGCCSTCGRDTVVVKCECLSDGTISRMIGPCPDIEQRVKDLYIVNTVAGWAKNQLRILAEMAADHNLPGWWVAEVQRIHDGLETVIGRENARTEKQAQ